MSSTGPGSCSRPRSSTRTCTCARPAARTRRRSRPERPRPPRAATAPSSPCPTPIPWSTRPRRSARSSRRRSARPRCSVGFLAAITRGQEGAELTEMGELADAGAVAFSDDGVPVGSAGLMRRALQYASTTGPAARAPLRGAVALARRARARGRRRGGARLHRVSVGRRVGHGRARPLARRVRGRAGSSAAPVRGRVGRRAAPRARRGRPRERRGDAAPSLPHRRGGALARLEREDEPAAPRGAGPAGAARGAARRDDRVHRHRPRTARAAREGGAVRGGAVRRHRARDRVRRALHAARRDRAADARDAAGAALRRSGARVRNRRAADRRRCEGESRPARSRPQLVRRGAGLPLALAQLVAARRDAEGRGRDDDRGRSGGARRRGT